MHSGCNVHQSVLLCRRLRACPCVRTCTTGVRALRVMICNAHIARKNLFVSILCCILITFWVLFVALQSNGGSRRHLQEIEG